MRQGMIKAVLVGVVTLALFGWIGNIFINMVGSNEVYVENLQGANSVDIADYAELNSATTSFDYDIGATENENVSLVLNGSTVLDNYTLENANSGTVENDVSGLIVEGTNTWTFSTTAGSNDSVENATLDVETNTDILGVHNKLAEWGPKIMLMLVAGIVAFIVAMLMRVFGRI